MRKIPAAGRLLAILAAFAAVALPQGAGPSPWRHFGDGQTPGAQTSLAGQMLASHNRVRAEIPGVKPLEWSDDLANSAQKWANHLLETKQFVHSHTADYGENLYQIDGARVTPAQVVKAWADEAHDYSYSANSCRATCGHYTQIIWNTTEKVGCAVASAGQREIWVCEYNPPGNWVGKRPY